MCNLEEATEDFLQLAYHEKVAVRYMLKIVGIKYNYCKIRKNNRWYKTVNITRPLLAQLIKEREAMGLEYETTSRNGKKFTCEVFQRRKNNLKYLRNLLER